MITVSLANLLSFASSPEVDELRNNADIAFRRALELDAHNPDTRHYYAAFLASPVARFQDPARAIVLTNQALALTPNDRNLWNTLGIAQFRNDQPNEAVESLLKSIDLRFGGTAEDHLFLAMAYGKLGNREKALLCYQHGTEWLKKTRRKSEAAFQRLLEETETLLAIDPRTSGDKEPPIQKD